MIYTVASNPFVPTHAENVAFPSQKGQESASNPQACLVDYGYDGYRTILYNNHWTSTTGKLSPGIALPQILSVPVVHLGPFIEFLKMRLPFYIHHPGQACVVQQTLMALLSQTAHATYFRGSFLYPFLTPWCKAHTAKLGANTGEHLPLPISDIDFRCKGNEDPVHEAEMIFQHLAHLHGGGNHGTISQICDQVRDISHGTFVTHYKMWKYRQNVILKDAYLITYNYGQQLVDIFFQRVMPDADQLTIQCFSLDITPVLMGLPCSHLEMVGDPEKIWQGIIDLEGRILRFVSYGAVGLAKAFWLLAFGFRHPEKLSDQLFEKLCEHCLNAESPSESVYQLFKNLWIKHYNANPASGVAFLYHLSSYLSKKGMSLDLAPKIGSLVSLRVPLQEPYFSLLSAMKHTPFKLVTALLEIQAFLGKCFSNPAVFLTEHDGSQYLITYYQFHTLLAQFRPNEALSDFCTIIKQSSYTPEMTNLIQKTSLFWLFKELPKSAIHPWVKHLKIDRGQLEVHALELLNYPQKELKFWGFSLLFLCHSFDEDKNTLDLLSVYLPELFEVGGGHWTDLLQFLKKEDAALLASKSKEECILNWLRYLVHSDLRIAKSVWLRYAHYLVKQDPNLWYDLQKMLIQLNILSTEVPILDSWMALTGQMNALKVQKSLFASIQELIQRNRPVFACNLVLLATQRGFFKASSSDTQSVWLDCCVAVYRLDKGGKIPFLKIWKKGEELNVWSHKISSEQHEEFLISFLESIYPFKVEEEEQVAFRILDCLHSKPGKVEQFQNIVKLKQNEGLEGLKQIAKTITEPLDEYRSGICRKTIYRGILALCQERKAETLQQMALLLANPHLIRLYRGYEEEYLLLVMRVVERTIILDPTYLCRFLELGFNISLDKISKIEPWVSLFLQASQSSISFNMPQHLSLRIKRDLPFICSLLKQEIKPLEICKFILRLNELNIDIPLEEEPTFKDIQWAVATVLSQPDYELGLKVLPILDKLKFKLPPRKQLELFLTIIQRLFKLELILETPSWIEKVLSIAENLPLSDTQKLPALFVKWSIKLADQQQFEVASKLLDALEQKSQRLHDELFQALLKIPDEVIQKIPWVFARVFRHQGSSSNSTILRVEACVRELIRTNKDSDLALDLVEKHVSPASALLEDIVKWSLSNSTTVLQKKKAWCILKTKASGFAKEKDVSEKWIKCWLNAYKVLRSGCYQALGGEFEQDLLHEIYEVTEESSDLNSYLNVFSQEGLRMQGCKLLLESCLVSVRHPMKKVGFLKKVYTLRTETMKKHRDKLEEVDYQKVDILLADRIVRAQDLILFNAGCIHLTWLFDHKSPQSLSKLIEVLGTAFKAIPTFEKKLQPEVYKHLNKVIGDLFYSNLDKETVGALAAIFKDAESELSNVKWMRRYLESESNEGRLLGMTPFQTGVVALLALALLFIVLAPRLMKRKNDSWRENLQFICWIGVMAFIVYRGMKR